MLAILSGTSREASPHRVNASNCAVIEVVTRFVPATVVRIVDVETRTGYRITIVEHMMLSRPNFVPYLGQIVWT